MNKVQEHTKEFSVAITMDAGIVTLDNTEIRQLYFIEDIFSFALVGKMIIQENRGIFEFGPLTGNETITLVYGEDEERVRQFKIYKINKIDQVGNTTENVEAIEIFFADNIFFVMNFLQFSRSGKDTIISTIIKELGDNYLEIIKGDKFEETNEKLEYFYMPYGNIKTAIHGLIKRSTGKKSGEPGFCFYSNSKGVNFITLESLLKEKRLLKLSGNDDGIYSFHEANDFYFNKILSWSVSGIDMASLPILAGGVKKGFNSLEKKFINKEFEYKNSISKMTLLGGASLFPDISQKNVAYQLLGENNEDMIDTMYHNNGNKKYVLQQAVSLVLRGHEDRTCGSMIEIFGPSGDIDDHYNKHMHGKYLIKSVTHVFSGYKTPAYQQKLICIKNGYGESDVPDLVKASKRNN